MKYHLTTQYDHAQSFYGKAIVEESDNKEVLLSYSTPVITIDNIKKTIYFSDDASYSATTLRHCKEFIAQKYGYTLTKKFIQDLENQELTIREFKERFLRG